jgi:hypothetical protein
MDDDVIDRWAGFFDSGSGSELMRLIIYDCEQLPRDQRIGFTFRGVSCGVSCVVCRASGVESDLDSNFDGSSRSDRWLG